jgi:hypothetical protein
VRPARPPCSPSSGRRRHSCHRCGASLCPTLLPPRSLAPPPGTADGGAKLWVVKPWAASASDAIQCLGVAWEPDQRHVLALDACVAPAGGGGSGSGSGGGGGGGGAGTSGRGGAAGAARWQLLLGVGKALGGARLWRSAPFAAPRLSPRALAAAVAAGEAACVPAGAHGCASVTGVCVDPWAPGLVTCCLGGAASAWRLDAAAGALAPAGDSGAAAPRVNPRARLPKSIGVPLDAAARPRAPAFGLAASGNRLVVAAVRSLAGAGTRDVEAAPDAKPSRMTYNRVARGWLQLLLAPSAAAGGGGGSGELPKGMARALAALPLQPAPAAAVWDLACGVALGGWRRPEAAGGAASAAAGAALVQAGPGAALLEARAARRAQQAQQRVAEVRAQAAALQLACAALLAHCPARAAGAPLDGGSDAAGGAAWRALQAAAALRRAVLRLWLGPQQVARDMPAEAADLESQITTDEMRLVQRHVCRALAEGLAYCCGGAPAPAGGGGGEDGEEGGGKEADSQQQQQQQKGKGKAAKQPQQQQRKGKAVEGPADGAPALPPRPRRRPSAVEAAAAEAARLSRLLMADWACLHVGDAGVVEALLQASKVYDAEKERPLPNQPPPAREANPFGAELPRVAVLGRGPAAARGAAVDVGGGPGAALPVPRCAATLRLAAGRAAWRCGLCERRYLQLPTRTQAPGCEDVPRCLVCGVRLSFGPAVAGALEAPSLALGPPSRVRARVP